MCSSTEAFWVNHCDDESCSLGGFEYTCPCCNRESTDYQVWFEFDNVLGGDQHEFECERCKAKLIVWFDQADYETRVRKKE